MAGFLNICGAVCGGVAICVTNFVAPGFSGETYDHRRERRVMMSECECDNDKDEGIGRREKIRK